MVILVTVPITAGRALICHLRPWGFGECFDLSLWSQHPFALQAALKISKRRALGDLRKAEKTSANE